MVLSNSQELIRRRESFLEKDRMDVNSNVRVVSCPRMNCLEDVWIVAANCTLSKTNEASFHWF